MTIDLLRARSMYPDILFLLPYLLLQLSLTIQYVDDYPHKPCNESSL